MKISLNKLRFINEKYQTGADLVPDGVDALVEKVGAQLGEVEEVTDIGSKYEGALIVKVVECEKLEDSDHLSLCKIDDGGKAPGVERDDNGLVQVVCGAQNVHAGMLAAWLPPGMTVPASVGTDEPFVLEAREIRGKKSNGMLASLKELAIGDDHSGILEVDEDVQPGTTFNEAYRAGGEKVIDIENKMFTHRPDCFGLLGIAREIAGIQSLAFKSPDWYTPKPEFPAQQGELKVTVKNELPSLVPRFVVLPMNNIKVQPSPVWLQFFLSEMGVRPINNIVDLTNYYMLLTGQPLHAYDYDKVKALSNDEASITIRNPKPSEKIKLLGGKVIEPPAEAMMIAADKLLIGLGGIMGGADTEVDNNTKNIILECASFDMYATRRTGMALGLFTDAATRFTKGQSPLQNLAVIAKIADDIVKMGYGRVAGPVVDDNHVSQEALARNSLNPPVKVSADFINQRLGLKLSADEMKKLLENVEFKIDAQGEELTVTVPFWRTDIELREDVVEEIGRLYGYDKLPLELPRRNLTPAPKDPLLELKAHIRQKLARAGANEVLTYSFVHGNLLDVVGQDTSQAFQLSNALSPDLQYYRPSLVPSLLEKVHPNIKAGYDEFALFEIGKTHGLDQGEDADGLPREFESTGFVVAAADKLKKTGAPYYEARTCLEALIGNDRIEYKPVAKDMEQYAVVRPYNLERAALVSLIGGDFLGIVGEFKPSVSRHLKLPQYCAGFEIDTLLLQQLLAVGPSYLPLSRFPSVKQDITLRVPTKFSYEDVSDFVTEAYGANAPDDSHIAVELVDIYQKENDAKQFTFRLTTTGDNRTLTDKEINSVIDAIAAEVKAKFGAERI